MEFNLPFTRRCLRETCLRMSAACSTLTVLFAGLIGISLVTSPALAVEFEFQLRYQQETAEQSQRFHRLERAEAWAPAKTAVIVCDMWDSHHCYRAVGRVGELTPRMNDFLIAARQQGATIIHAPSECMDAYADHPARLRAMQVPVADSYPQNIGDWCYVIDAEDTERYPIDQSDGGEDDTPEEHARWEAELKRQGRNPRAPWKQQTEGLDIDRQADLITDKGKEVWNILQDRQIENVILVGVHTNMCVLGRPFGLRRLAEAGKNVVLCRDLTDTMYNPRARPYVSHFSGTDLIVDYIERYVCPTISSDQLIGGEPFRFAADKRPHIAIVLSEPEYETIRTVPLFARERLRSDYRLSFVYGSEVRDNELPGIELIDEADVMLMSVRRRTPPPEQLAAVRQFVASGRPVIGIRTSSHAFCLRNKPAPAGTAEWPEFDAQVFGGSYTNHYGNSLQTTVTPLPAAKGHPILQQIPADPFISGGSLYKVMPLAEGTEPLLEGAVQDEQPEPVAWTFRRADGGKSFYTSLGAPADFDHPVFQQLLLNAVAWATE